MTRQLLTDDMRRRLVEARVAKGWSISEMCKHVAHHHAIWTENFEEYEAGDRKPDFELLDAWCEALGLKLKVEATERKDNAG